VVRAVVWGSSILNAGLWFRRSALQSTTFPALEVAYYCVCLLRVQFFALPPFSGAGSECHPSPLLSVLVTVHCFSVLEGSLVLDTALWLRRLAL
jgi:hypothetical protein